MVVTDSEPKEGQKLSAHLVLKHYSNESREVVNNSFLPIIRQNRESSFLYRLQGFGSYHIIFAFHNDLGADLKADLRPFPERPHEDIFSVKPIDSIDQGLFGPNIRRLSFEIAKCLDNSLNFDPVVAENLPRGIIIDGHSKKAFQLGTGGGLGIKASISQFRALDRALVQNDQVALKDAKVFFEAQLVHEETHFSIDKKISKNLKETLCFLSELSYVLLNNDGKLPVRMVEEFDKTTASLMIYNQKKEKAKKLQQIEEPDEHVKGRYLAIAIAVSILSDGDADISNIILENNKKRYKEFEGVFNQNPPIVFTKENIQRLYEKTILLKRSKDQEALILTELDSTFKKFGIDTTKIFSY